MNDHWWPSRSRNPRMNMRPSSSDSPSPVRQRQGLSQRGRRPAMVVTCQLIYRLLGQAEIIDHPLRDSAFGNRRGGRSSRRPRTCQSTIFAAANSLFLKKAPAVDQHVYLGRPHKARSRARSGQKVRTLDFTAVCHGLSAMWPSGTTRTERRARPRVMVGSGCPQAGRRDPSFRCRPPPHALA
jgi:hypothetical protein